MLWSINSCRKRYLLTSVTWLHRGLRYTTHWGDINFKFICLLVFKWLWAQVHFLRWEFCLLCAYGKSWITWPWLNPYIKEANFCQEVLNPQGLICRCLLYSLTSYPSLLPSFTSTYSRNKYVVNRHKTWCGNQVKPQSGVQTGWVTCCEYCVLRTPTCFFTLLYYHRLFTKLWKQCCCFTLYLKVRWVTDICIFYPKGTEGKWWLMWREKLVLKYWRYLAKLLEQQRGKVLCLLKFHIS